MDHFDVIVIGAGAGENVVSYALGQGASVALVERSLLGGTCLNTGCIPSKMLIYPADVIRMAREAKAVGVDATAKPDFRSIVERMRAFVTRERTQSEQQLKSIESLTLIRETAEFVGPRELKAGGRTISAPKIVVATGARPLVPPIPGLAEAGYLDNVTLLELDEAPGSLIIVGGGYIGCEYGHFFSAMGTKVTIVGRPPVLLNDEDPEVSEVVTRALSRYVDVRAGYEAARFAREGDRKVAYARNTKDGSMARLEADEVLVALGRRSNSDLLKPEKAGIDVDGRGWIKVNQHLETSAPGVWALGDAIGGRYMFRHTANYQADVVSHNMYHDNKIVNDEHAVPHAVYTHPQVGHVGMYEAEAKQQGLKVMVGRAKYSDTAKGVAMADEDGLVKVVVEARTGKILGCSVVGPEAAVLVQQVVYLMNCGAGNMGPLYQTQVIHPALSEVVMRAFANLEPARE
jgi:dihydrolipoamide dehydrogenase